MLYFQLSEPNSTTGLVYETIAALKLRYECHRITLKHLHFNTRTKPTRSLQEVCKADWRAVLGFLKGGWSSICILPSLFCLACTFT